VGQRLSLGRLANVISTNVPGPRETRWLCGARAFELRPLVPIADGLGLGLAVFSYDDWLHIGLAADADLVPDLEKLERGLEEAFASLLGSSGGGAPV
jgi:diacylglycerol O-acyltransferase